MIVFACSAAPTVCRFSLSDYFCDHLLDYQSYITAELRTNKIDAPKQYGLETGSGVVKGLGFRV